MAIWGYISSPLCWACVVIAAVLTSQEFPQYCPMLLAMSCDDLVTSQRRLWQISQKAFYYNILCMSLDLLWLYLFSLLLMLLRC